ncbi:MAG: hypothetical protein ACYCVZ_19405 [Streptosporangiaceae bacterium]
MPKPRGGPFKAARRDTRFQAYVEALLPPAFPWGTEHTTPVPVPDQQAALEVQRGIYRSARHLGVTAHHVRMVQLGDGTWVVRFRLAHKDTGRQAIVEKVERGEKLAYNLRRNQP